MIQSKFYYPVRIMGGIAPYETLAPGLITLPLPLANPPYGPVAILESEVGEQPQGMYVMTGMTWDFALTTIDLCRAAINGDALSVYVNPTAAATAPPGSTVYLNGQVRSGQDITVSKGVWLVRTPKSGGSGGGAVDSVNGQIGDVLVNATNLPGLSMVGKTGQYSDLLSIPAAPIASTTVLGNVIVPASSKLTVDAQGNIGIKPDAVLANIVTVGQGNSLYAAVTNGLLAMKSLSQGTGITIVDDSTGNLTINATASALPIASASVLGGVKVGTGLAIAGDGTLSVTSVAAPLTLTGDVTGTGTGTVGTTLSNTGISPGNYDKVTVDAKGRVTAGGAMSSADVVAALGYTPYNSTNPSNYLTQNAPTTLTGDVTGTGTGTFAVTLAPSGVSAGTFRSVTVDAKGRVTAGTNPTTLSGYGITDALGSTGGSLTGTLTLSGSGKITGVPTAVNPSDAVNLQQVQDAVAAAMTVGTWKTAAQAATTGNLAALTGLQIIDTYQTVAGDRVLVKNQTTASQNGVYVAAAGAWTRATDVDTGAEIFGAAILVLMGDLNKFSQWVNSNSTAPVIGTDPITWSQLATAGQAYSAGAGLTLNGSNQFSITPTGATAGTFGKVTVNTLGQVTNGAQLALTDITTALGYTPYNSTNPSNYISANQNIAITGDATGSGTTAITLTLTPSGATAGTYTKVTVDAKGRVTLGAQLSNAEIVTAIGYTPVNRAGDTMTGALNLVNGADLVAASAIVLGTGYAGNVVNVTGNTAITSLGANTAGMTRYVTFTGTPTLTYNATSLQLPTKANIVVTAGDTAVFVGLGGSNWRCVTYTRVDGSALLAGGASDPTKLPLAGGTMTGALNEAVPVTVASAATTAIGAAAANTVNISGAVTITAFDSIPAGALRQLVFAGALTLTHNATSLQLPSAANIVTAAGDVAEMLSLGSGNWKCVDYVRATGVPLIVASTFTTTQRFIGSVTAPAVALANAVEIASLIAAAPAATQNFYVASGAVQYHTVAASANWVLNFAWSASQSMNNALAIGESSTVAMMTTQGATAYLPSSYAIDGTAVTPRWQGGTAPTAGNANAIDVYTFTILKTAANTYTVLAAQTQYK